MSKNNTIRKSDKKFIRREKARIRRQFLDIKKQKEMIDELYKRFQPMAETEKTVYNNGGAKEVKAPKPKSKSAKREKAAPK